MSIAAPMLLFAAGTLLGEDSLLVVKDPARHAYLRALLQPAFGPDAIASYLPDIEVRAAPMALLPAWHVCCCF